ncbi:hypothetical protein [Mycobacterium uberis]|uniref:hypothetical protein n=1 Tax=Mycobacterium uberis TaxID=2162698 RepID=UPI0010590592|nr:hypothetical protein [Mycobacterium uberis]
MTQVTFRELLGRLDDREIKRPDMSSSVIIAPEAFAAAAAPLTTETVPFGSDAVSAGYHEVVWRLRAGFADVECTYGAAS